MKNAFNENESIGLDNVMNSRNTKTPLQMVFLVVVTTLFSVDVSGSQPVKIGTELSPGSGFQGISSEALASVPRLNLDNNETTAGYDYEPHELNDAWLGMPVRGVEGMLIGYVSDAVMDNHGYLKKLVIDVTALEEYVVLHSRHVAYSSEAVELDLSNDELMALYTDWISSESS